MAVINDLTQGKPSRVIWTFSLPLLLSTALQQIYNIADSMIVGWLVGEGGLAAQLFGSKRLSDMKSAIFTAIFSLCILGIVLAGAGVLLSVPLMRWLNASDDILGSASA